MQAHRTYFVLITAIFKRPQFLEMIYAIGSFRLSSSHAFTNPMVSISYFLWKNSLFRWKTPQFYWPFWQWSKDKNNWQILREKFGIQDLRENTSWAIIEYVKIKQNNIYLRDNDTASKASQRLSRSLADISVSGNKGDLSSQHDISGPGNFDYFLVS